MATATALTLAEYLQTSYRPDREFIDGELKERNVGKWEHARLQSLLARLIGNLEDTWGVISSMDQRIQVSSDRVRIPDVVVLIAGFPPPILIEPPLLVIEILSPDDSYSDLQERSADYLGMGVSTVWVLDPKTRTARMCIGNQWTATRNLHVPGTAIQVDLDQLFAQLDRTKQPS